MKLAELQAKFQDAILGEDRDILAAVNPSQRLGSAERFAVYAEAYRLRLAGFLREDFKVLHGALGDEDFDALCAAYIDATPSQHPNARWYARKLPEFMQATAPWSEIRAAIDIALFERALADAFDAEDSAPRVIGDLAAVAPEDWPNLRFEFHDSLALLTLMKGIVAAYAAAAEETPCPPLDETQDENALVWRSPQQQVLYRLLDAPETLALTEAAAGKTFGEICALLAFRDEDDAIAERAAGYLAQWFAAGLVTAVDRA